MHISNTVLGGHLERRCVEGVDVHTKAEDDMMQEHKHFWQAVMLSQLYQCFSSDKLLSFSYIYIVESLQRYPV